MHNNVCQSSIHVAASDGRWRLGGMEHVRKIADKTTAAGDQGVLERRRPLRYAKGLPPEEKDTTSASADDDLKARDVFSLGVLIDEVLAGNLAIATLTS